MYKHYPKGRKLPALEKNMLKYRALEMVIVLFYSQRIKDFVTSIMKSYNEKVKNKGTRYEDKEMDRFLAEKKLLTAEEARELRGLISDYRNHIGHRIHQLTCDISYPDFASFFKDRGISYDYSARKRVTHFYRVIWDAVSREYAIPVTHDELIFEYAERAYEEELSRLDSKIRAQIKIRKREHGLLKKELESDGVSPSLETWTAHPLNKKRNGALTERGKRVCYSLFDKGKSALAASYMMRISYRCSTRYYKKWESIQKISN